MAVQVTEAESKFEAYYIPETPKEASVEHFPQLPEEYLQTPMYKLLQQCEVILDALVW